MRLAGKPDDLGRVESGRPADGTVRHLPFVMTAAMASIGAGIVHAGAIGIHAEHPQLARIFVVMAVLQLGVGLLALGRPSRSAAGVLVGVNAVAVAGWIATRAWGIGWVDGLGTAESPQFADSACAVLGAAAAGAAAIGLLIGWRQTHQPGTRFAGLAVAALTIPALAFGSTHVHSHDESVAHTHSTAVAAGAGAGASGAVPVIDESQPHDHTAAIPAATTDTATNDTATNDTATTDTATAGTVVDQSQPHQHGVATPVAVTPGSAAWPRPYDPTQPVDISGVAGVSAEQQQRATDLILATQQDLPRYADPQAAVADGYASIGDAGTGTEHYIKTSLINDDDLLDANAPESLVYKVDGDKRTLAGAMYIAGARPADDRTLTGYAGPLMQWHRHDNLCWGLDDKGQPKVVGIIDANGNCANGIRAGGENPMVHVWIVAHPCGVFAALEGIGAGTAVVPDAQRVDMCTAHTHTTTPVAITAYDPTKPIDLSGTPGVTPEQQAAAENLVAVTVVRLPQWSDYHTAEAAGFKSIGDGLTGFEHFIQWDWINDSVTLDPDHPESLVYVPQPDGSKKLVSAMYMLPSSVPLTDAPVLGGALTQWHIHDNLCFTTGDQPFVAGITSADGSCPNGLKKFQPAPMIHVWITPNKCGPFAALEGVGAGQIDAGQERLCDHVHGTGGTFG